MKIHVLKLIAWFSLCLCLPVAPAANYYECPAQGEDGTTLFSDTPCGTSEKPIELPDDSSFTPSGDSERGDAYTLDPLQRYRLDKTYMRRTPDRRSAVYGTADSVSQAECVAATRSLEVWRGHLRSGYTFSESQSMHEELRRRLQARDQACR